MFQYNEDTASNLGVRDTCGRCPFDPSRIKQHGAPAFSHVSPSFSGVSHSCLSEAKKKRLRLGRIRKEFRRAIELDPNSVPARLFHAELLQATGKNDEAVAEVKRAVEIDPLSVIANQAYGSTLYYSRRYDESARALGKTIELDPSFVWAGLRLARVYDQMGRYSDAEAEFQRVETGARSVANLRQAHLYAVWGKRDEALRRLARWDKRQDSLLKYDAAEVQVALGDSDAAFAALEQAALDHNVNLICVKVDPELDPIRNDPRFDALLKRLGLY